MRGTGGRCRKNKMLQTINKSKKHQAQYLEAIRSLKADIAYREPWNYVAGKESWHELSRTWAIAAGHATAERSSMLGCGLKGGCCHADSPGTKRTWEGARAFRHTIQMLMFRWVILSSSHLKCLSPESPRSQVSVSVWFRDTCLEFTS